jgi:hypothetical protein
MIAACVAFAALGTLSVAQRMEPNSFLNKPADTVGELVAQASSDKEVMSRYMRHFGMTRDEVIAYLKTLRRGEIAEDGVYLTYNTPESGEIRARVLHYRKGTPVFVDRDGNYIMRIECGNPMVRGTDLGKAEKTETVALRSSTDVRELIVEQPPGISTTSVTGTTIAPPIAEYDAIVIEDMPPALPEAAPQNIINPVLGLIIPFTGAIMLNDKGGEQPIPEPASMIALSAGLAGYMVSRKRRKKAA